MIIEGFGISLVLGTAAALLAAYLVGSIPWAYIIVRAVTGEDVTTHGTGNVGAMNVRRTTGSWAWFTVAMLADVLKGVVPVAIVKLLALGTLIIPTGVTASAVSGLAPEAILLPMAAVAGVVLGHNYSLWMA
ncbi:glycerol-3-phosphate acyltransferase, partial [bacterium]|nr:glycerol-3-phosphate acyltransferase [bacterium]